jgi:hypothetical protein
LKPKTRNQKLSDMRQLSSNWTMAFRLFFPTFWLGFFGTFLLATLFSDKAQIGSLPLSSLQMGLAAFVGVFIFIFWKTLFKLYRVDADSEHIFVTNYFKAVRYPHRDVEKIELTKGFIMNFGTLVLKGKGRFGQRVLFLVSRRRLELFMADNPHLVDLVVEI